MRWPWASTARSAPTVMDEWTNHRLSGQTLQAVAAAADA